MWVIMTDMSILRKHLKSQGITQADFAKQIEVTQGYVAKLCGDHPKLSLDTALEIEKATDGGVPVESWPQFAALANRSEAGGARASA